MLPLVALVPAPGKPSTWERDLWHQGGTWVRRVTKRPGGTTWIQEAQEGRGRPRRAAIWRDVLAAQAGKRPLKAQEKPPVDFGRNSERFET